MRRVLLFVGAFGVWVRFACTLSMLFGYPVPSSWMSCCGIPTRNLRIILNKFLVMCVFSWVFLAALIIYINYGLLGSICSVEVLMCVLQALSLYCVSVICTQ
jgi:hypothetical protein